MWQPDPLDELLLKEACRDSRQMRSRVFGRSPKPSSVSPGGIETPTSCIAEWDCRSSVSNNGVWPVNFVKKVISEIGLEKDQSPPQKNVETSKSGCVKAFRRILWYRHDQQCRLHRGPNR